MARTSFEIIGKLSLGKETEKFKPWEEKTYDSGWKQRTLKANAHANGNNILITLRAGIMGDNGKIYLYDTDKKEKFQIPYKDRTKKEVFDRLKGWQYFTLDCYEGNRYLLELAYKNKKAGKAYDKTLETLGIKEEELEAEYEKAQKMVKHFLSGYDFAEAVHKIATSEKFKNKKWKIRGDVNFSKSNNTDSERWFVTYSPNKIYIVADDEEEKATSTATFFFGRDAVTDMIKDKGEFIVDGKVSYYDDQTKSEQFADYQIVVKSDTSEKAEKINKIRMKRFTVNDDSVKEVGVVVNLMRGAETVEIREEDLNEEQQEALICGDITLEDIRKEMGHVKGDFREANVFCKWAQGYSSGAKDTGYTLDDLIYTYKDEEPVADTVDYDEVEDDEDDIFGDI